MPATEPPHTMNTLTKADQITGRIITLLAIGLFLLYAAFMTSAAVSQELSFTIAVSLFVIISVSSIFVIRKYRKENNSLAIDYFNVGIQRHILGLFMVFYGIPKLFGGFFDYQLFALDSKLGSVSEFELAWYFYGKNRWQELFSGIMELVPGLLLFHRRTYYAGAILLLPVTAQVFILNLFFKIGGVTFPAAVILLACNLYILYSEKEKIRQFIRSLDFSKKVELGRIAKGIARAGKILTILLAVYIIGMRVKNELFQSAMVTQYRKLVGMYSLQSLKKNGREIPVDSISTSGSPQRYYRDLYIEKQSRWNILRKFDGSTDAFMLDLNPDNDSIRLFINKGGIGDDPDIKDTETVIKGTYQLDSGLLIIKGVQLADSLELIYKKSALIPKEWFW